MKMVLGNRIHLAVSWSLIQEVAVRGLQFAITIILARILGPREFGLVAMLTVFIALAQALLDGGFAAALIQKKQPTETEKCSIFYFNLMVSGAVAAALWLAAPAIAAFYDQPALIPLTRVLAWIPLINGLIVVPNTLLIRNLELKKQTLILVASLGLSGSLALILASRGWGVWSLVLQQVTQSAVRAILLWVLVEWRPRLLFSFDALRQLFAFGWAMLCSSLLNTVFDNLHPVIIGRAFSAIDLGYYGRAASLQTIVSQSLGSVVNRVTLPVFSGMQDETVRLRAALRNAITSVACVQFPIMVGLAATAKSIVLILLSDQWAPSIPYLQLLSFVGLLYPIHLLNLNVLLAVGRSDLFLRLGVLKLVLFVVNALATMRWGVIAMIWGQIAYSLGALYLNAYYTKSLVNYSFSEQLRDLSPSLLASALMGSIVLIVGLLPFQNEYVRLLVQLLTGITVYAFSCYAIPVAPFKAVVDQAKQRWHLVGDA